MSDIICVPLTVSRRQEKRQRRGEEERERQRDGNKKRRGLRSQGKDDGKADRVKEDDRNEA